MVWAEEGWALMKTDPCDWVLCGDYHGKHDKRSLEGLAPHFAGRPVEREIRASRLDLDIIGVGRSPVRREV